ncbi:MAG TPA: hypothetical protein VK453_20005 [Micromonosporaceae bacterium]|nr:hypothetical protein [Micromonosporaceae bacterium]
MELPLLLLVLLVGMVGLVVFLRFGRKKREAQALADAREEALRWYERLGGQVMNLAGDDPAVKQALVDAGERYNAAGSQLERATSVRQYELARETALEGLAYARAARIALNLDPGPDLPPLAGQRAAGAITKEREVEVQGQHLKASPRPQSDTPYYYPGGNVAGRPVPSGWYSNPWWKTALVGGAWGLGSVLMFNALLSPAWGDTGYDAGFQDGVEHADGQDGDVGADGGGEGDAAGAYDDGGGYDSAGYDNAGYDTGGGDWGGGGDFGGGDFGGGDFGGGDF